MPYHYFFFSPSILFLFVPANLNLFFIHDRSTFVVMVDRRIEGKIETNKKRQKEPKNTPGEVRGAALHCTPSVGFSMAHTTDPETMRRDTMRNDVSRLTFGFSVQLAQRTYASTSFLLALCHSIKVIRIKKESALFHGGLTLSLSLSLSPSAPSPRNT